MGAWGGERSSDARMKANLLVESKNGDGKPEFENGGGKELSCMRGGEGGQHSLRRKRGGNVTRTHVGEWRSGKGGGKKRKKLGERERTEGKTKFRRDRARGL